MNGTLLPLFRRMILDVKDEPDNVVPPLDASLQDKQFIFSALPISKAFASAYRRNMRHWALIWRRARQSGNHELATIALYFAIANNRWAKEAA